MAVGRQVPGVQTAVDWKLTVTPTGTTVLGGVTETEVRTEGAREITTEEGDELFVVPFRLAFAVTEAVPVTFPARNVTEDPVVGEKVPKAGEALQMYWTPAGQAPGLQVGVAVRVTAPPGAMVQEAGAIVTDCRVVGVGATTVSAVVREAVDPAASETVTVTLYWPATVGVQVSERVFAEAQPVGSPVKA